MKICQTFAAWARILQCFPACPWTELSPSLIAGSDLFDGIIHGAFPTGLNSHFSFSHSSKAPSDTCKERCRAPVSSLLSCLSHRKCLFSGHTRFWPVWPSWVQKLSRRHRAEWQQLHCRSGQARPGRDCSFSCVLTNVKEKCSLWHIPGQFFNIGFQSLNGALPVFPLGEAAHPCNPLRRERSSMVLFLSSPSVKR